MAADNVLGVVKTGYVTSGNNYAVKVNDGNAYVNIPTASSTSLGIIKTGYTTSGRNYAVQVSNGNAYVNVPWTDENTTYSVAADGGLVLDGTVFSVGTIDCGQWA